MSVMPMLFNWTLSRCCVFFCASAMIITIIPSKKKKKCNKVTKLAVRPIQPPIHWLKQASFQAVKRPGHEADHSYL